MVSMEVEEGVIEMAVVVIMSMGREIGCLGTWM